MTVLERSRKKKEGEEVKYYGFLYYVLNENGSCLKDIFNIARQKNVLREFLGINLYVAKQAFQSVGDGSKVASVSKEYKLVDYIVDPKESNLFILDEISKSCGLKEFWEASSEVDHTMIKGALKRERDNPDNEQGEKDQYKDFLEKITKIECELELNSAICNDSRRFLDLGDESESRKDAAKKGMKFGAIGGAITALAVGLGLYFGTSAALTVLPTIIGIALVAALVVGAAIGAITYDFSKPDSSIDTVYTTKGFGTVKQEANTAAGVAV